MKKIVERLFSALGYILIKRSKLENGTLNISKFDASNARGKAHLGLEKILKKEEKNKWLEVGTGGRKDVGFDYIDIIDFPPGQIPSNYKRLDIINCTAAELQSVGKYDFIRMQHVFEHFTPEDGLKVLHNCSLILNPGGYILISCPDIDKVIMYYLNGNIKRLIGTWGTERFGENAPDSFYFSIFTHSVLHEPHMWCYNADGIIYQLETSKQFTNIEILDLENYKSAIPFTHNRPTQDVTVIAQKKSELY